MPVRPDELSGDLRSRRRRTIDPNQLAALEEGEIGAAYAYSFIVTNLDWEAVEIEAWFRMRALVEEKIKDAKHGTALRHLPSGFEAVNRTWMCSAFLVCNVSVFLQSLTDTDTGPDGRAHGNRRRRELIAVRHACSVTPGPRRACRPRAPRRRLRRRVGRARRDGELRRSLSNPLQPVTKPRPAARMNHKKCNCADLTRPGTGQG